MAQHLVMAEEVEMEDVSAKTVKDELSDPWELVKSEDVKAEAQVKTEDKSELDLPKSGVLVGVTDLGQVKASLMNTFATVCDRYGGPSQYLLDKFPSETSRGKFREELLQAFPLQSSVHYVVPSLLGKKENTMLHVSMLGFTPETSTKPFPYSSVCKQLFEEYLTHGFLTDVEPLRVWSSAEEKQKPPENFTVRYVKGSARSSSLLALLSLALDAGVDIPVMLPHLAQGIVAIHASFECHVDIAAVAIANAHHSNRGSIRQPHDIVTWTMKLLLLEKASGGSYAPSQILEKFNAEATSKGKVTGNKRVAALALLNPKCHTGLELMVKLLGHVGLKGVWWSEDSFCNKKLLPGHVPRLARSEWNSILTANGYSFTLFVESLSHQQVEKKNRRSLEKLRLEEHSQLCAFWSWAVHEALANAIAVADIEILCNKVIKGDVALTLDLQSLLHERKNGISWLDLFLVSFKLMMYKICFPSGSCVSHSKHQDMFGSFCPKEVLARAASSQDFMH